MPCVAGPWSRGKDLAVTSETVSSTVKFQRAPVSGASRKRRRTGRRPMRESVIPLPARLQNRSPSDETLLCHASGQIGEAGSNGEAPPQDPGRVSNSSNVCREEPASEILVRSSRILIRGSPATPCKKRPPRIRPGSQQATHLLACFRWPGCATLLQSPSSSSSPPRDSIPRLRG